MVVEDNICIMGFETIVEANEFRNSLKASDLQAYRDDMSHMPVKVMIQTVILKENKL